MSVYLFGLFGETSYSKFMTYLTLMMITQPTTAVGTRLSILFVFYSGFPK